jgi:flagellar motor switch protein FliN/FliY
MSDEEQLKSNSADNAVGGAPAASTTSDTPVANRNGTAEAYHPSDFGPTGGAALGDAEENLSMILDIPVSMSIEVGRTRIPIRNLLQLSQGSVVELDRVSGEPMDVLINGTLIARGEVVVVNEKYGIRLTDIISHADRIKRLTG